MNLRSPWSLLLPLLAFVVLGCHGQEFSFGGCRKFPIQKNFDKNRYLGKWYEYSNYFFFFQMFGKCVTATYSDESDYRSNKIGVLNEAINERSGEVIEARGEAVLAPSRSNLARLIVNFDSQPFFVRSSTPNYNVIETDYDNYAIVYTCSDKFGLAKSEILWILTRQRFPDRNLIQSIKEKIRRSGIDTKRLRRTDQKTCPPGH